MADDKIYALVDYGDEYVQPLLVSALERILPSDLVVFVKDAADLSSKSSRFLQWKQYEDVDFEQLMQQPSTSFANTYVIRKALIRKHFLSNTVAHWVTKYPETKLKSHIRPSVEFEVDYAEFLDDALVEAFELRESWERNEDKEAADREWWILKPGMSDRGQGIRLFSTEEQLSSIFEEWDPPSDNDEDTDQDETAASKDERQPSLSEAHSNGVIASQLRHFIAQPYIDPPLLLPNPHPSAERKFHIRTYVLAVGALRVFVYKPMLALFAGQLYTAPSASTSDADDLSRHLTNTCLQTGEREGSVHPFWSLPRSIPGLAGGEDNDWREDVFSQICDITGEVFEAASRSMSIHFQPLPNAFEIFGVDFLVDAQGTAWLLEVNSFPDFAQTGEDLKGLIGGLFEAVAEKAIKPFFGITKDHENVKEGEVKEETLVKVLDIDLGRR